MSIEDIGLRVSGKDAMRSPPGEDKMETSKWN